MQQSPDRPFHGRRRTRATVAGGEPGQDRARPHSCVSRPRCGRGQRRKIPSLPSPSPPWPPGTRLSFERCGTACPHSPLPRVRGQVDEAGPAALAKGRAMRVSSIIAPILVIGVSSSSSTSSAAGVGGGSPAPTSHPPAAPRSAPPPPPAPTPAEPLSSSYSL